MTANVATILLQAQGAQPGGFGFPIMMLGMVVVMYFFMIRPQQKRAKEAKKFAETIGVGEQVITTSGIHGRITRENEDGTLKLEVSNNIFLTIERSAVSMELTAAARKKNGTAAAPAATK
jgi:preprotein translocase subunit YajC